MVSRTLCEGCPGDIRCEECIVYLTKKREILLSELCKKKTVKH
ncbi:MAG: hypothetical protein PHQ23_11120 [Candidatus Wallbacteria bacterium]|nr:hypothetical protein [Candidatus Wallbacteria bacterium]